MLNFCCSFKRAKLILLNLFIATSCQPAFGIIFEEVSSLHVWLTVSSLANREPNNAKSLLFRQIELNWINAPLEDDNDYIGLYLDGQPEEANQLPVSVHRLNGQASGQLITDYYLPQIDFYNETVSNYEQDYGDDSGYGRFSSAAIRRPNELEAPTGGLRRPQTAASLRSECLGYCLAYHSRNKILARNCLMTNPTWMQDTFRDIGPRSLPALMIPGTHNSGTYPRGPLDKTVLHMINKYQMNQDESIFNQLVFGIRYLDLRVGYSKVKHRPERLWVYHDIFRTEVTLNEVLDQVRRFLDLTSHEIVIMDFHRFTVGFQNEPPATQRERHAHLVELLFKRLGQYLVPSYLGHHAPLQEYVQSGKRLLVGYAHRNLILGDQHQSMFAQQQQHQQVRDVDAHKQDQDESQIRGNNSGLEVPFAAGAQEQEEPSADRRVGTRLYNRLKSLKLISNSFSKRSIGGGQPAASMKLLNEEEEALSPRWGVEESLARVGLFFPPVRHLWPNKDTLTGLAQYMNETTCRRYFGELRSMMAEMTPTVFGAIADKYDGNRRLAQLVNRPVTDWIRDRWLHCLNIVASDFFLGNDLIRLAIQANKMRASAGTLVRGHQHPFAAASMGATNSQQCGSFRRVEHLLDKSKIPIQFAFHSPDSSIYLRHHSQQSNNRNNDIFITHTSSDGQQILLKPLTTGAQSRQDFGGGGGSLGGKRDSFVENVADGFTNLVSSFKRLLNL